MTFEIFKGFPPDRESAVAEFYDRHDGVVDVPAQLYREDGQLKIAIYGREGGIVWEYSVDDWIGAIEQAVQVLGDE